jgi:hypothetical protein
MALRSGFTRSIRSNVARINSSQEMARVRISRASSTAEAYASPGSGCGEPVWGCAVPGKRSGKLQS